MVLMIKLHSHFCSQLVFIDENMQTKEWSITLEAFDLMKNKKISGTQIISRYSDDTFFHCARLFDS